MADVARSAGFRQLKDVDSFWMQCALSQLAAQI
jgi:hypothetical protein